MKFVVLNHFATGKKDHFDFMLENGEKLKTWSLDRPPSGESSHENSFESSSRRSNGTTEFGETSQTAKALPDHRRIYLEYEGEISNNRGFVRRWDQGTFVWTTRTDDEIVVRLEGERLRGTATLVRLDGDVWRFVYRPETVVEA